MMDASMPGIEAARPLSADARTWSAPLFDGSALLPGRSKQFTEMQREEERRIFSEAEAKGRVAGLAAGKKDYEPKVAALEERARTVQSMLDALSRPLGQLDDQIHEQIATLAVRIARAVIRRELRMDPTQIIGIVRETVALLPASTHGPRVVLNPQDAALVRECLQPSGPEAAWSIVEDAVLARGDCRVYTDHAQLDARLDARLNEALAALIGDERARDRAARDNA